MYICICNGVTDSDIREAAAAGADSLDALREELGVASCCGTCACAAEAILEGGQRTTPVAASTRGCGPRPSPSPRASL